MSESSAPTVVSRVPPGTRSGPANARLLGRSRAYTAEDLPERLRQWHAPRINRWERLRVTAGALACEYLDAAGTTRQAFTAPATCWFAPGTRWRIVALPRGSRFELEVHADDRGQAEAPQPLRTRLLSEARREACADAAAVRTLLDALPTGARRILDMPVAARAPALAMTRAHTLFWHPLAASDTRVTVLVARSGTAFDLAAYLGRDHAVIEAALGGTLAGNAGSAASLEATLERHLQIEERLVFPAYLECGGRQAWVDGLLHEHGYLRRYLAELDQPLSRRRFLRLLDGHDEKEERVIYPDVLAQLGERAATLLDCALGWPLPTGPATSG